MNYNKYEMIYHDFVRYAAECWPFENDITREEIKIFDMYIKSSRYRNVLDIGCGIGRLIPYMKQKRLNIVAVDISCDMIQKATNIRGHNINYIVSDILDIGNILKCEKYDYILCMGNTIGAFLSKNKRKRLIAIAKGLLKEDGVIFIDFMPIDIEVARSKGNIIIEDNTNNGDGFGCIFKYNYNGHHNNKYIKCCQYYPSEKEMITLYEQMKMEHTEYTIRGLYRHVLSVLRKKKSITL